MQRKTLVAATLVAIYITSASGCIAGNQNQNEKTVPLATSILTVNSLEAMRGYNASLSCTLNATNGKGLHNQTIYWYIDGNPLAEGKTFFGFAFYNLSSVDVFNFSIGEHKIVVEYKGDANYIGTRGEGLLLVIEKSTSNTPLPSVIPRVSSNVTSYPSSSPSLTPIITIPPLPTPTPAPSSFPTIPRLPTPTPAPSSFPTIPRLPRLK
jgi:hypothetical protein